jgi:hypothetical protein
MIKNLPSVSTTTTATSSSILSSSIPLSKSSKSSSAATISESQANASLLRVTPRKLEAIALLISSIAELIGQIREMIKGYQNRSSPPVAPTSSPATPSELGKTKSSATPTTPPAALTQSAGVPPVLTTDISTTAQQDNGMVTALSKVLEKFAELQQMLSSLFVITGPGSLDEQTTLQHPVAKEAPRLKKSFWGDVLNSVGKFAVDLIPGKEMISGVSSFIKSGSGFLKGIFSSLFV